VSSVIRELMPIESHPSAPVSPERWGLTKAEVDTSPVGIRFSAGKPRFDLIPVEALEEWAKVCEYGARKYADRNWEKGMPWGEIFRAILSHAFKFWRGQRYDEESGLHHLAHALWNVGALLWYDLRAVGTDNRPCTFTS
jgi:hypothetical protein